MVAIDWPPKNARRLTTRNSLYAQRFTADGLASAVGEHFATRIAALEELAPCATVSIDPPTLTAVGRRKRRPLSVRRLDWQIRELRTNTE